MFISTLLMLIFRDISILTFFASSKISQISNKNFSISNSTFFVFSTNLIEIFTLTFIDKLIIDLIVQKTRLFNTLGVETKFRFVKNFSITFLIDLVVLFNCNFVVIKVVLILFVKVFLIDFHESKIYKKIIANTQHKIN